jgi:hypothetical protein
MVMGVFLKIEPVIRAVDGGFQVAEQSVDPVKTPHAGTSAILADNSGRCVNLPFRRSGNTPVRRR